MVHETPAERRRKVQESRILDAALELVGELGFDALSIKGIAERADYSPAALYRYFESKDELVAALALRAVQGLGLELARCPWGDPLTRVARLSSRFVAFAFADDSRFALIHVLLADPRVLVDDAKLVGEVLAAVMEVLAPLAQALNDAAQEGSLEKGSASDRALLLASSLLGLLLLRKQAARFPRALALESLAKELVETLLKGFGADEQALLAIEWRA